MCNPTTGRHSRPEMRARAARAPSFSGTEDARELTNHWRRRGRKGVARRPFVFLLSFLRRREPHSDLGLGSSLDEDQLSFGRLLPQLDERRVLGRVVKLLRLREG